MIALLNLFRSHDLTKALEALFILQNRHGQLPLCSSVEVALADEHSSTSPTTKKQPWNKAVDQLPHVLHFNAWSSFACKLLPVPQDKSQAPWQESILPLRELETGAMNSTRRSDFGIR
jgi:hypothetical protein